MSPVRGASPYRLRKVRLALTDDEYALLQAEADRTGKPMALLLREAFFGIPGKSPAIALLEEALFLRMNGEYAPGHTENWHDWDRNAETFLRGLLPPEDVNPVAGQREDKD